MVLLLAAPFLALGGGNLLFLLELLSDGVFLLQMVGRVYAFNTLVFPGMLAFSATVVQIFSYKNERMKPIRIASFCAAILVLFILSIRIYATHIEPYQLTLRTVVLPTAKLDRPLNLLHISDIQSEKVGHYEESVFSKIREINPDLILHTGDLMQTESSAAWDAEFPKMAALFATLSPPLGMWSIIGNTDAYTEEEKKSGVGGMKILEYSSAEILWGSGKICLYGIAVHDPLRENKAQAVSWLKDKGASDFTILMGHNPVFILEGNDLPIDLCLAGHTHGGQIRIPGFGPLTVLCPIPLEWGRGFHAIGNTKLNVSAGIGYEHCHQMPPIRLFCPPEMTLFQIVPAEGKRGSSPVETAAGPVGDIPAADQSVR